MDWMRRPLAWGVFGVVAVGVALLYFAIGRDTTASRIELGRALFFSTAMSRDGKVACASCHDPEHAFADPRSRSIGVDAKIGARNAPSLVGIARDHAFFWDGRRGHLKEVVLDPFTNPVELGLASREEVIDHIRRDAQLMGHFRAAFPLKLRRPTVEHVSEALVAFVQSLGNRHSAYDESVARSSKLPPLAEQGRQLFDGAARCNECHVHDATNDRFSDGQFHHSGVGQETVTANLPALTKAVIAEDLSVDALGPKLLTNSDWSSLGRFVVTHKPAEIGAFLTPSLRNVAVTAPYMHDGSIASLEGAVDHEIYYRGLSRGQPIVLSAPERKALAEFLGTLTDKEYQSPSGRGAASVDD